MLLFEHCPNLRIHLAGEKSLTSPHTDRDHQHSQAETLAAAVCEATSDPWRNHYAIRIYIYIYIYDSIRFLCHEIRNGQAGPWQVG